MEQIHPFPLAALDAVYLLYPNFAYRHSFRIPQTVLQKSRNREKESCQAQQNKEEREEEKKEEEKTQKRSP